MKRTISLLLALVVALFSAVGLAEEATKDFSIVLTGNPTTGYEWKYVMGEEGLVTVEEEFLTSADIDKLAGITPPAEPMPGEGGFYNFIVKGVKPGKLLLAFEYAQSWDENSTEVGLTYALTVHDDLSVTCTGFALGM